MSATTKQHTCMSSCTTTQRKQLRFQVFQPLPQQASHVHHSPTHFSLTTWRRVPTPVPRIMFALPLPDELARFMDISRQSTTPQPSPGGNFTNSAIFIGIGLIISAIIGVRVYYRLRKRRAQEENQNSHPPRRPQPIHRQGHQPPTLTPPNAIGQGQFNPYAHHRQPTHPHGYPPHFLQPGMSPTAATLAPVSAPRAGARAAPPDASATPRFDPEDLVSFEATGDDKSTACAICLEPLEQEPVSAGQCLHLMHTSCLKDWLVKDPKVACPVCRVSFTDSASVDIAHLHDYSHHSHDVTNSPT